ncbi:MAG: ankyrin repeat domain-containing protein [Thermofilum sp.]|nr:ankyrin repeat domain-containing protein [Thermofilum sp.]
MNLDEELFKAVENGDIARVKELLKKGANVNAKTWENSSPLHVALARVGYMEESMRKRMVDIVKILVESGADLNAKDVRGITPLHLALLHEHFDEGERKGLK